MFLNLRESVTASMFQKIWQLAAKGTTQACPEMKGDQISLLRKSKIQKAHRK